MSNCCLLVTMSLRSCNSSWVLSWKNMPLFNKGIMSDGHHDDEPGWPTKKGAIYRKISNIRRNGLFSVIMWGPRRSVFNSLRYWKKQGPCKIKKIVRVEEGESE